MQSEARRDKRTATAALSDAALFSSMRPLLLSGWSFPRAFCHVTGSTVSSMRYQRISLVVYRALTDAYDADPLTPVCRIARGELPLPASVIDAAAARLEATRDA